MEKIKKTDFHTVEMSDIFATLDPHPPITTSVRAELAKRGPLKHDNERDHMSDWFYSQVTLGHGQYSRRRPNTSARVTYNRLLTGTGLLWISEALEVNPDKTEAIAEIILDSKNIRTMCADIRKVSPWSLVCSMAQHLELVSEINAELLNNRP